MSRNSDKANTVLFRFQEQKAEAAGYIDYNSTQRPRSVQKVTELKHAENWRKQVLKEISEKSLKIQDEKLSDYQIRDLNDEMNKLMREKTAWEYRIKELGGVDYLHNKNQSIAGGVVIRGYTYFGRAKELKGVKELILKQKQNKQTKMDEISGKKNKLQKLKELEARVNLKYYGYLDEQGKTVDDSFDDEDVWEEASEILGDLINHNHDDSEQFKVSRTLKDPLLKYERKATKKRLKQLNSISREEDQVQSTADVIVPVFTNEEVQKYLVDRRRRDLEKKYNI